jgi:uncharacterized protein DUF5305
MLPPLQLAALATTLQRHRRHALALGVGLLLLCAAWSYDAAGRIERIHEVTQDHRHVEQGVFTYSVPVVVDSAAWANGTVLGMGEPGYFSTISPRALVNFTWEMREGAPSNVQAVASLVLAVRAEQANTGRVLWSFEDALAEGTSNGSSALVVPAVLDIPAIDARVRDTVQTLGLQDLGTAWTMVATVSYTAQFPWGQERNTTAFTLPVERAPPMYMLPGADALRFPREHADVQTVVHEQRAGAAGLVRAPLGPLAFLAGAALLVIVRRRPDVPDAAASEHGAFEAELARYRDWVIRVHGPLPAPAEEDRVIDVDRLDDLVSVASEVRSRVLLDEYCRVFWVYAPGAAYRYRKHGTDLVGAMALAAIGERTPPPARTEVPASERSAREQRAADPSSAEPGRRQPPPS